MDLKKITAFVILALLTLPSLTMVVRADDPTDDTEDGAGLAGAIERARLYLDKVRTSAETLARAQLHMENNIRISAHFNGDRGHTTRCNRIIK